MQTDPRDHSESIISYASRSLTDVESRYYQIEREALAICWAIQHYKNYLLGRKFVVNSDHSPLQNIFNGNKELPARIERWVLKLQQYDFKVVYTTGSSNPSDCLSRSPSTAKTDKQEVLAEEFINCILKNYSPKSIPVQTIIESTNSCPEIQYVKNCLKLNKWKQSEICKQDKKMITACYTIRDELTETEEGLLLKGNKIVVPEALQDKIVKIAHEGH